MIDLFTHNSDITLSFRPILQERASWQQLEVYHFLGHRSFNLELHRSDSFSVQHTLHLGFSPPRPPCTTNPGNQSRITLLQNSTKQCYGSNPKITRMKSFLSIISRHYLKPQEAKLSPSHCKSYTLTRLSLRILGPRTQQLKFLLTSGTATREKTKYKAGPGRMLKLALPCYALINKRWPATMSTAKGIKDALLKLKEDIRNTWLEM